MVLLAVDLKDTAHFVLVPWQCYQNPTVPVRQYLASNLRPWTPGKYSTFKLLQGFWISILINSSLFVHIKQSVLWQQFLVGNSLQWRIVISLKDIFFSCIIVHAPFYVYCIFNMCFCLESQIARAYEFLREILCCYIMKRNYSRKRCQFTAIFSLPPGTFNTRVSSFFKYFTANLKYMSFPLVHLN